MKQLAKCEFIIHIFLGFFAILKKKQILEEGWLEKVTVSWSETNSEPCQTLMKELKVVTFLTKDSIMFDSVLNTPLMMTVARYWEGISNKTKILFSVHPKNAISSYSLQHGSIYNINDGQDEKNVFVLENQTDKTTVVEWNEGLNI